MTKYTLCSRCYQKMQVDKVGVRPSEMLMFQGCEGENELSQEEETALLKELQSEDSDLAVERRPESFVPSSEGIE